MSFYPNTIAATRKAIELTVHGTKPEKSPLTPNQPAPLSYLLWMANEVEKMDNPYKAGRWIGWLFAHLEIHGVWSNDESRRLAKLDSTAKADRP